MPKIPCDCGERLSRGSYPSQGAFQLLSEEQFLAHPQLTPESLADLYFFRGSEAHLCHGCRKLLVYWRNPRPPFDAAARPHTYQAGQGRALTPADAAGLACACGHVLPRGHFPNHGAYRLLSEERFEALPEPPAHSAAEMHEAWRRFFIQGAPEVLHCPACQALLMILSQGAPEGSMVVHYPVVASRIPARGPDLADLFVGGDPQTGAGARPVDVYTPTSTKVHHVTRHVWLNPNQVGEVALNLKHCALHQGHFGASFPRHEGQPGHGGRIGEVKCVE